MSRQQVSDPAKGKYFSQILHMADDDLGPYAMRLLVHYARVAGMQGKCWEGVRATATITQMSVGMVTQTRNELVKAGYIRVKHRKDDTCVIVIVDRWAENIARYAAQDTSEEDEFEAPSVTRKRSPHEHPVIPGEHPVHHMNTPELESVHHMNERIQITKEEEPKKKRDITPSGVDAPFSPLTGKTKQPRATKNPKKDTLQTTTPPPSPTPSAPKLKSILAWVIDDAWAGHEGKRSDAAGMSMRLIPVLMGTSKKHDCIDPVASEAEIYGFTRWYRWMHPNTPLPMESKLASWFGQWRASSEYPSRLETAQHMVSRLYHAESSPPVIEEEYVPLDHPVYAKLDALLARTIIGGDL